MKVNKEKINQFFESDKFDEDIKEFVLEMLEILFKDSDYLPVVQKIPCESAKILFLDLGFYEIEGEDIEDDARVINFYELSKLTPKLRKLIIDTLLKLIKDQSKTSEFFDDFVIEDLKILVYYENWKKTNRKNKLETLNKLN